MTPLTIALISVGILVVLMIAGKVLVGKFLHDKDRSAAADESDKR